MNKHGMSFVEIMVAGSILMGGLVAYSRLSKFLFDEERNVRDRYDANRIIQEIVADFKANSLYMVPENIEIPEEVGTDDTNRIENWERGFFTSASNQNKFAVRCFDRQGSELIDTSTHQYKCDGKLEEADNAVAYIVRYFKARIKIKNEDRYPMSRFHLWVNYRGGNAREEDGRQVKDFFTRVYKVDALKY